MLETTIPCDSRTRTLSTHLAQTSDIYKPESNPQYPYWAVSQYVILR